MRLTLTTKIIAPYGLLGGLVLALLSVLFVFDLQRQSVAAHERALLGIGSAVREIAARVQTGILTRQESLAIEIAQIAGRTDGLIGDLGASGADLRAPFQDYFAAMVAINSVYLENRTEEGARRLDQLREQERRIDATIAQRLSAAEQERNHMATLAWVVQGAVLVAIIMILVVLAMLAAVINSCTTGCSRLPTWRPMRMPAPPITCCLGACCWRRPASSTRMASCLKSSSSSTPAER